MNGVAILQALQRFELHTGVRLPNPARLLSAVKVEQLKPRESAFVEAEPCSRVFVVRSGFLKQLYIKEDGSEWIKSFTGPGDLFACLEGLAGRRTTFASEAIEPSVVESVEWRIVEELAENDVVWQKAIRLGFQYLAQLKVRRERDLLMLTAEELYRQFVRDSPALAQRVSQRDLAAFLGVTPVGLNRIVRRNAGLVKGRGDASASSAEGLQGPSHLVD